MNRWPRSVSKNLLKPSFSLGAILPIRHADAAHSEIGGIDARISHRVMIGARRSCRLFPASTMNDVVGMAADGHALGAHTERSRIMSVGTPVWKFFKFWGTSHRSSHGTDLTVIFCEVEFDRNEQVAEFQ